jgi:hypothetical protein
MNNKEEYYGGMMNGITDKILEMLGFSKEHVDKIKFILDTIKIDDEEVTIQVNDKIKVIIKK